MKLAKVESVGMRKLLYYYEGTSIRINGCKSIWANSELLLTVMYRGITTQIRYPKFERIKNISMF